MRKLSLLLLACLTLGIAWAERVSVNTAQQVAANVAAGLSPSNLRSSSDLKLVYAAPAKQQSGLRSADNESDYYIFNVGTGDGFIIVAGEDRVRPVLGYSAEGEVDMEKMPGNMKAWLEMYQREISWAVSQNISASGDVEKAWQMYVNGSQLRMGEVRMLPKPTALWSQGEPFDGMTPLINGEHALTGCVATAQAIVMKYYEYPAKAVGGVSEYAGQTITYDGYDWANMLTDYSNGYSNANAEAVAKLMWHCGANVEMDYGTNASGASTSLVSRSLKNVFGYSQSVQYVEREAYRWADWKALISNEIDQGHPVILSGTDPNPNPNEGGGHAFICDGYTSDGAYHINWGWGGYLNGYFLLSTLDEDGNGYGYSTNQGAVIGIHPTDGEAVEPTPFITAMMYNPDAVPSSPLPVGEPIYLRISWRYSGVQSINFKQGLGVVDNETDKVIYVSGSLDEHNLKESGGVYSDNITMNIMLNTPLAENQRIAMVYSTDGGQTWQVEPVGAEVPIGLNNQGLMEQEPDDPNEPDVPVNVEMLYNHFDKCYIKSNYSKQGSNTIQIGGTTEVLLCYDIVNSQAWFDSGMKMYYSFETYINDENKAEIASEATPDQEGKVWINVPTDKLENNRLTYYIRFEWKEKVASTFEYDLNVCSVDKSDTYATFNAKMAMTSQYMTWTFSPSPLKGVVDTDIPFSLTATNVDEEALTGEKTTISLDLLGIIPEQATLYYVEGENKTPIDLSDITYIGNNGQDNLSSRSAAITIPGLKEGATYNFILRSNVELPASEDRHILIAETAVDGMSVLQSYYSLDFEITAAPDPITWTFTPDKLEGIGGSEQWFSIKATNVGDYEGQKPMISLNIEGALSDEVAVSYVTSDFTPIQLNVTKQPDWPDSNLCITTPYEVEALTEGKEYKFIFRYIGGFTGDLPENGDIQLESVTVNGTALELDPNAGVEYILTAPEKDIEVSGKEVFYEESHKGKVVNVYSDGIYIVNEPNASIKELRIQPGGQVSLLQELDIEVLNISHFIPTSKWTTFGAPNASEKIVFGDGEGTLLEDGTVESRIGYSSASQQEWIKSLESDFQPGFAALFAHSTSNGELGFHRAQEATGVMTLPVRVDAGEINKPNGNWFHFVANPNWENLQLQGRAYVLDETGLNFALRENPIIKPFEAYMVASDEVMANVSNLRIGDIPTSNEDLAVTGFRVWSESGHVCFETTEAKDVAVYSMNGVQQCRFERSVGVHRQQLPQGIYIVVCDGTAYKVSVK